MRDDSNNNVLASYDDGTVSMGTTDNLSSKRAPYGYQLPGGYSTSQIVETSADLASTARSTATRP
ncbi:MAG TPA: hypothetical protein VJV79_29580 [Polyangiaceae bacterium]|nr:hypothetical protein [Polyangiaceae bacterium]